jgi:hypothetical protein
MDSFWFDLWTTNPDLLRFVLVCRPWIRNSKGSYRIVDHKSSQFSKGSTNPTNPTNPHESLVLYTKQILMNNPRVRINKSDSMESFRVVTDESNLVYPRIQSFQKGSIHIDSEGFVYNSRVRRSLNNKFW